MSQYERNFGGQPQDQSEQQPGQDAQVDQTHAILALFGLAGREDEIMRLRNGTQKRLGDFMQICGVHVGPALEALRKQYPDPNSSEYRQAIGEIQGAVYGMLQEAGVSVPQSGAPSAE